MRKIEREAILALYGTQVTGVKTFIGSIEPTDLNYKDARNEKRKQTKLETARKRGLLNDVDV